MNTLEIEMLHRVLTCDPETGKLHWRERSGELFSSPVRAKSWNIKFAGKQAFTANSNGYRSGAIFAKNYMAHTIVFAMATGHWPNGEIDHINGTKDDNRIVNLRDITHQDNGKNSKISSRNTSGHTGVYWSKKERKWFASIRVWDEQKRLGCFSHKEDAIARRKAAEIEFGFHENHGRRA